MATDTASTVPPPADPRAGGDIVVAPDKFKGSLSAGEAATHLAAGLRSRLPAVRVVRVPVADGGDGFLDAAVSAGSALDAGNHTVLLGLGGSACTDGGAGLLQALGVRLARHPGGASTRGGTGLAAISEVDLSGLHPALATTTVLLASDVDNPLLGAHGAAAIYGPQKGASPEQVDVLDRALAHWADRLEAVTGTDLRAAPGAGAAGGVGFGLLALGATVRPGIDLVLELTHFDERIRGARLVVTGEGTLDEQSLRGKAPLGVAARARAAGVPVVAVAGRSRLPEARLRETGIETVYPLAELEPDPDLSMRDAGPLLERVAERIAADWEEVVAARA